MYIGKLCKIVKSGPNPDFYFFGEKGEKVRLLEEACVCPGTGVRCIQTANQTTNGVQYIPVSNLRWLNNKPVRL